MIDHSSFTIDSQTGQGPLYADLFRPAAGGPVPLFSCLVIHGMAEHRRRYHDFATWLASRGGIVCLYDQAGHGESATGEEKLGFFATQGGADCLLADVDRMSEILRQESAGLPQIQFGHSMGSLILRDYLSTNPRPLAGAILSGTMGPNPIQGLGEQLARWSVRRNGLMHRDPLLEKMLHLGYLSHIPQPRSPFDWLSRDQAVVAAYQEDPLCGFPFTNAGLLDLMTWTRRIGGPTWADQVRQANHDLPILMLSGAVDPVGQYGQGVRKVYRWLADRGQPIELHMYPGGRHEMLNEINKQEVYDDIWHWIRHMIGEPA